MSVTADMIGNREALDGVYLEATLSSLLLLPLWHQHMLSQSSANKKSRQRAAHAFHFYFYFCIFFNE